MKLTEEEFCRLYNKLNGYQSKIQSYSDIPNDYYTGAELYLFAQFILENAKKPEEITEEEIRSKYFEIYPEKNAHLEYVPTKTERIICEHAIRLDRLERK